MISSKIPLFIIAYNRLSYLKQLVDWLQENNIDNVLILDNNSTYPPLLEYYDRCPYLVVRLKENFGHFAVWRCGLFDRQLNTAPYIVNDCDVVPVKECPADVIDYLLAISTAHPNVPKVGLSLKIDDLPDHYIFKTATIEWEKQYYAAPINEHLYKAQIDTTFALYKPKTFPNQSLHWYEAIRTAHPYAARHLPWYENSETPSDEMHFYKKTRLPGLSTWDSHDIAELQLKYVQLLKRYNETLHINEQLKDATQELLQLFKHGQKIPPPNK